MAWGFVIYAYLPDGPHNAKMLSEYERVVAVWRISRNQTGLKQPKIVPSQIKEALLDPRQLLLYLMAACYGILNGGVANFLAAIIKGFGYSALRTSLLQTPVGAFQLVMVIALVQWCDAGAGQWDMVVGRRLRADIYPFELLSCHVAQHRTASQHCGCK